MPDQVRELLQSGFTLVNNAIPPIGVLLENVRLRFIIDSVNQVVFLVRDEENRNE